MNSVNALSDPFLGMLCAQYDLCSACYFDVDVSCLFWSVSVQQVFTKLQNTIDKSSVSPLSDNTSGASVLGR